MKTALSLLAASMLLAGCLGQPPRSSYDVFANRFGPEATGFCERYAYQSGRTRFENLRGFMGTGWLKGNANRVAATAYERCRAGDLRSR